MDGSLLGIRPEAFKDVRFAIAHVNDKWLTGFNRKFYMPSEPLLLDIEWTMVPVPIKACFANGYYFFQRGKLPYLRPIGLV